MPRIRKKPPGGDALLATVAKLQDARTLLVRMQRALDREIRDRKRDVGKTGIGWTHYGDAGRLLEELKEVGHLLMIDRNEVDDADACPCCGTRDVDRLRLDESEVQCTICGCEYSLD